MPEGLRELQDSLQGVVTLMRENADEMRQQDTRLQDVESLLKEKDSKLQEKIDALQDSIQDLYKKTRTKRGEEEAETKEDTPQARYQKAFDGYLRGRVSEIELKTLSVDSEPDGGFLVTPEMDESIRDVVRETSPMRQVASVITISTDAYEGVYDPNDFTANWVTEGQARTATATPALEKFRIPTHEAYAMPEATQKLLDDAFVNVEQWLGQRVADRIGRLQNVAFVTGTGVGQPRGFATYADGTAWGQVEQIPSGDANLFTADGLMDLRYGLPSGYLAGAAFAMNRSSIGAVRKLQDGAGAYVWQPDWSVGGPGNLLGYPVVEMNDMADEGAGNLAAAFANWSRAYAVVENPGVRVLRDPFTNKPFVRFYTVMRAGGGITDFNAIKIQDIAAS